MKKIACLLILLTIYKVHGQKLLHLQRSIYGSVIPYVQSPTFIDPCKPISKTNFPHNFCKDSLFVGLYLSNDTSYSNISWSTRVCADRYSIPFSHFGENAYMVNCADPWEKSGIDIISDESLWSFSGNTWQYHRTVYRDGATHSNFQTWQLDEKSRIKTTKRKNEKGEIASSRTYYYNVNGLLKRTSLVMYKNDYREQSLQQQEWFYDQKDRTTMMITYMGAYKHYTSQQLSKYKKELEQTIKTGYTGNIALLDTDNVKQLLVYNYSTFGLEQVNCYRNEDWTYDDRHLLSDSLFYDTKGRVSRYKGGETTFELQKEIIFTYDSISGLLTQIIGHHYGSNDEVWFDDKIVQELTYGVNNKVNYLNESHYIVRKDYVDGNWTEPLEWYFEGAYFPYKYLH